MTDGIYIVIRESAEGSEVDCFTDRALAEEWAGHCDGELREEFIIDRALLDELKRTREEVES